MWWKRPNTNFPTLLRAERGKEVFCPPHAPLSKSFQTWRHEKGLVKGALWYWHGISLHLLPHILTLNGAMNWSTSIGKEAIFCTRWDVCVCVCIAWESFIFHARGRARYKKPMIYRFLKLEIRPWKSGAESYFCDILDRNLSVRLPFSNYVEREHVYYL